METARDFLETAGYSLEIARLYKQRKALLTVHRLMTVHLADYTCITGPTFSLTVLAKINLYVVIIRLSDSLETARDSPEAGRNPVDTARGSRDCQRHAGDTMDSDRCSLDTARYPLKTARNPQETARHPLEITRLSADC